MSENESIDGATTALHQRIEELTAELEREWADHCWEDCGCREAAAKALATERAAREQLADKHMQLKELYDMKYRAHEQAERERDTALARVKELEAERDAALEMHGEELQAAESALASALARVKELEMMLSGYAEMEGAQAVNKCICGQDARFTHVCLNGNTLPAQRPERTPFEELVRRATVATMPEQELREHVATLESRICSLQSERDTALARAKEWELAYDSSGFGPQTPAEVQVFLRERDRVNGQAAALRVSAAETALASAREILWKVANVLTPCKLKDRVTDWLEKNQAMMCRVDCGGVPCGEQEPCIKHQHPAPVAAPHPSCIYAVCKQGGPCMYPKPDGTACSLIEATVAERAARKQAQETAKDCARVVEHFRGERDTALARVAELEAQLSKADKTTLEQAVSRLAAESALASARTIAEEPIVFNQRHMERRIKRIREALTSHPAPAAAPCAGCDHEGIGLPGCSTCDPMTGPRTGALRR